MNAELDKDSLITAADALSRLARSSDGESTCGRTFIFYTNELLAVAEFLRGLAGKETQQTADILGRTTRF